MGTDVELCVELRSELWITVGPDRRAEWEPAPDGRWRAWSPADLRDALEDVMIAAHDGGTVQDRVDAVRAALALERARWPRGCDAFEYDARNYSLFERLGYVGRNKGVEPICYMRGLPEDASAHAKVQLSVDSYVGWLLLEELATLATDLDAGALYAEQFVALVVDPLRRLGCPPGSVRIIFGFDQ
jgi:hypothetical protein